MTNEEKILSMLEKIQVDMDSVKNDMATIKSTRVTYDATPKISARDAVLAMSKILNDEEKDALGRYQAAEEARKAELYG